MNNFIPKSSIYLPIILLIALTFLSYEMGFLTSVSAEGHPAKHFVKKKIKHLSTALKKQAASSTVALNSGALDSPVPQNSPVSSKPQVIPQLTDNLSSTDWWQDTVKSQVQAVSNNQYAACLFGDSISSGLGNTLGDHTFNFAIGGMSTVSLIEQLQILNSANVKCREAIIAIGTNDALYNISDAQFVQNLQASIAGVRAMGARRVILIPAFYSTVAASRDPNMAGTIERVNEINTLIWQVVETEKVAISTAGIQSLYEGQALKDNLTVDGVHLNGDGKKIYRQALLTLIDTTSVAKSY